jgi:hypothetical protein
MITMDKSIEKLYKQKIISDQTAVSYALKKSYMKKIIFSLVVIAATISLVSFAPKAKNADVVNFKVTAQKSKVDFTGSKKSDYHTGYFPIKSGAVQVSGGKLVGGNFVIDVAGLKVTDAGGGEKLQGHLTSGDFFDIACATGTPAPKQLRRRRYVLHLGVGHGIVGDGRSLATVAGASRHIPRQLSDASVGGDVGKQSNRAAGIGQGNGLVSGCAASQGCARANNAKLNRASSACADAATAIIGLNRTARERTALG